MIRPCSSTLPAWLWHAAGHVTVALASLCAASLSSAQANPSGDVPATIVVVPPENPVTGATASTTPPPPAAVVAVTPQLSPAGVAAADEAPKLTLPGPASDAARARLDYSDGSFYLRAIDDNLVFVPGARMHIDVYSFGGHGVSAYHRNNGSGLTTNLYFRRFVIELGGLVRKRWFYWVGGNFAPQQIDPNSASQAVMSSANVYDGFIGYVPVPTVRIYFGQYNAPFTMENVTSSRWFDFMERALTIRTVATPYNKADGLMVWGDTSSKVFEYQVGVFGGDGMNRPNIDNALDVMGRILVRPLAGRSDALQRLHIGGGARYGWRNHKFIRYDAPSLSTPGGYTFWSSHYGSGADQTHIQPYRDQTALAGELYIPFERFDVRGEFVYVDEKRREVPAADRNATLRSGALTGFGTYAQLSFWLLGTPRISGNPAGFYGILKVPEGLGQQAEYALQLALRGEWMRLRYDGNSRFGSEGSSSAPTDDIFVDAYQVVLNYWATKHIRVSAEYSLYYFPGKGGTDNQAVAPGVKSKVDPDAHVLNEFSFRVGLAL